MHSTKLQRLSLIVVVGLMLSGVLACDFGGGAGAAKPRVTCSSPVSGIELEVGQQVEIVCIAEDPQGIVTVELAVDGVIYATQESPNPEGQPQWKFVETWAAKVDPGMHTLTITAYNVDEVASDPVSISVTVVAGAAPEATGEVTLTASTPSPGTTPTVPPPGATETAPAPAPTRTTAAPPPTNTPVPPRPPTNTPVPARPPTNTPVPPPTSTPVPGLPDLVVYAIYLDRDTVPYGETVHATVMVVNQGNAPAAAFRVSWDFGSGSGGQNVPCCLGPNQSYGLEWDSLPLYASYNTWAMADESRMVQESNEGNNTLLRRVNVAAAAALPDLTVEDLHVHPPDPAHGESGQVNFVMRNLGSASAGAFDWIYCWNAWSPQEDCCTQGSYPGLAAGDAAGIGADVGPFYASYNTYLVVDSGGVVVESNEDNNRGEFMVDVH